MKHIDDYLQQVRERLENASQGPWSNVLRILISGDQTGYSKADAAFLGKCSEDIPRLLLIIDCMKKREAIAVEALKEIEWQNVHVVWAQDRARQALEELKKPFFIVDVTQGDLENAFMRPE